MALENVNTRSFDGNRERELQDASEGGNGYDQGDRERSVDCGEFHGDGDLSAKHGVLQVRIGEKKVALIETAVMRQIPPPRSASE